MNKVLLGSGVAMLLLAGSAQAIEGSVDAGRRYTNVNVGMGTTTPGFTLSGNWMRSDHDGSVAGARLGYNFQLGSAFVTPGVKAMYIDPQSTKSGYAIALGGGVQVPLSKMFAAYGEYYYAPESLSTRIDSYQEAAGGVSFTPFQMLNLRVGYKYVSLDGKDGRRDNVLANGPYAGASLRF